MKRIDSQNYSTTAQLVDDIQLKMKQDGYVIVKSLFSETPDVPNKKTRLLDLCHSLGEVTSHNNCNALVWDILERTTESKHITFSEHANEAQLHTDSQYSQKPEDYFALYCIKKAECGGGESFILSVKDIETELKKTTQGKDLINFFNSIKFPFLVPDVFKSTPLGPPEYRYGHVLKDGEMRFRIDAIERVWEIFPDLCNTNQRRAFSILKELIVNSSFIKYTTLENNECLFINNKTMLHGRKKFTDKNRHLLRIRFNKK